MHKTAEVMTTYLRSIDCDRASHRRNGALRTGEEEYSGLRKWKVEDFVGGFTRLRYRGSSEMAYFGGVGKR